MPKRVLIVDDEPQLLYSLTEYLTHVGYEVTPAESGNEGLKHLVETPPDLIVSDIIMEEMDGFEFQRRVNALTGSSIPFIFLTAKSDLDDRLSGLRGGADDYITKPFEPEELSARVAAVLNRVEQTRDQERRDFDALRARTLSQVASNLRQPVEDLLEQLNRVLSERFGEDPAAQEMFLQRALDDAGVLSELVDDLQWATSDVVEVNLSPEPLRIAPVVRRAAASASRMAAQKDVQLNISCGGLLSGTIDEAAMLRTLSRLLEAAVAISPPGSEVEISAHRSRDQGLEFIVTEGLPDEESGDGHSGQVMDALDFARHVVRGHNGKLSTRMEPDGRQSYVLWVPGRMPRQVGRRQAS